MKPGAGCAERDVLTGVPNTRASAITKRLESGRPFALLLADMEALKDTEGENALAVYRAASERLYPRKVMRGYVRGQQVQRPRAVS